MYRQNSLSLFVQHDNYKNTTSSAEQYNLKKQAQKTPFIYTSEIGFFQRGQVEFQKSFFEVL
jgi:hypothetical protein